MSKRVPVKSWRTVVGFADYEVSDTGEVRSIDRLTSCDRPRRLKGRLLKLSKADSTGHQTVTLYNKGVRRQKYVHQLVLEAFVSARPEGKEAFHKDDDGGNNFLSNLRWDTHKRNCQHSAGTRGIPVERSDGKRFPSINQAAREMSSSDANLRVAISKGWKFKGFTWKYF